MFANDAAHLALDAEYEERWTSIGHTDALRVLVVVWTMRGQAVRAITAWEANRRLREQYLKGRGNLLQ